MPKYTVSVERPEHVAWLERITNIVSIPADEVLSILLEGDIDNCLKRAEERKQQLFGQLLTYESQGGYGE